MADFRLMPVLRAYSGGTAPDLHRILYSPLSLYGVSGIQMCIKDAFKILHFPAFVNPSNS